MTARSSESGTKRRRRKRRPRRQQPPSLMERAGITDPPPAPSPSPGSEGSAFSSAGPTEPEEVEPTAEQAAAAAALEDAARVFESGAGDEAPPTAAGELHTAGEPAAPSGPDPAELGARLHSVVFSLLAARMGEHWKLTDKELTIAGEAAAPILAAVMTRVSGFALNATMYGVVLMSLVLPRLERDEQLLRERIHRKGEPDGGRAEQPASS